MTQPLVTERVSAFAAAVRAALSDLPADEVDDLVDGLEADLTDRLDDSDGGGDLGDPDAYAAELRAAAGLPARTAKSTSVLASIGAAAHGTATRGAESIRASRVGAWLLDLLTALRPAWWLLRGWAIYTVIVLQTTFTGWSDYVGIPRDPFKALLLLAIVVVSIQWGRGRWLPTRWLRLLRTGVNVVSVILVPAVLMMSLTTLNERLTNDYYATEYVSEFVPGLAVDGERIRNLYAYDADGNPIDAVQLFDQDGRPVNTVGRALTPELRVDEYFAGGGAPLPIARNGVGLQPVWNVYPLPQIPIAAQEAMYRELEQRGEPLNQASNADEYVADAEFPFPTVPALPESAVPSPSANPSPSATPSLSAAPSPAPSASPTPTPTP